VYQQYLGGSVNLAEDLRFWGIVILIFVPVSVVARIIIEIVFNIVNTIVTKEEEDPSFSDERDKLIELKATRISYGVVGAGFLLSMVSLVMEMPPFVMLNIVFCSFNVAQIVEDLAQLYFYRRGV
jgi:hypothetical protein